MVTKTDPEKKNKKVNQIELLSNQEPIINILLYTSTLLFEEMIKGMIAFQDRKKYQFLFIFSSNKNNKQQSKARLAYTIPVFDVIRRD